jgi:hypothetical protein
MMMTCHALKDEISCASVLAIDKDRVKDHLPARFAPETERGFEHLFDGDTSAADALLDLLDQDNLEPEIHSHEDVDEDDADLRVES